MVGTSGGDSAARGKQCGRFNLPSALCSREELESQLHNVECPVAGCADLLLVGHLYVVVA